MPVSVALVADPGEWQRFMRRAGDKWQTIAKAIAVEAVKYGKVKMIAEMKGEELVNTGYMWKHIATPVGLEGDKVEGWVIPEAPYAPVMDEGRRPNGPMPPSGPLALWAQRKLGVSKDDSKGVGYAIALSIKRKGIKGRHFMEATERHIERELPHIWKRQVDRFLGEATQ